jgi:hypothetical protein
MTNDLDRAEYEALRATIRERGSVRIWLILAGLITWAVVVFGLVVDHVGHVGRAAALVPVLLLAMTFEISFFIHTGVERVGRYLQVYYEETDGPARGDARGWETTIMAYGARFPAGPDPLFVALFGLVAAANLLITFLAIAHMPWQADLAGSAPRAGVLLAAAHLLLGWRFVAARRHARSQRATDLERFRALKSSSVSN